MLVRDPARRSNTWSTGWIKFRSWVTRIKVLPRARHALDSRSAILNAFSSSRLPTGSSARMSAYRETRHGGGIDHRCVLRPKGRRQPRKAVVKNCLKRADSLCHCVTSLDSWRSAPLSELEQDNDEIRSEAAGTAAINSSKCSATGPNSPATLPSRFIPPVTTMLIALRSALVFVVVGFSSAAIAADIQDHKALAAALEHVKGTLENSIQAGEQIGNPISAKFALDDGSLQLSPVGCKGRRLRRIHSLPRTPLRH
jgi:hypothetical protein